jgi:hypothetical protein
MPVVEGFTPFASQPASAGIDTHSRGALAAGLSSGIDDLAALGYSAVGAVSDAAGLRSARDWANRKADEKQIDSRMNGRDDLSRIEDVYDQPSKWLPYTGYQIAKQLPNIAGAVAAGAVMPEVAVPTALARGAALLPRMLGGGGMAGRLAAAAEEGGSAFAARRAALEAGHTFAKQVVGGGAFNYATGVGSVYQSATDGDNPDAGLASLAAGVPHAIAETLPEAMLMGRIGHGAGFSGNLFSRVAKAGSTQGVTGATSELVQGEIENSFNPTLTPEQIASSRLNAGVAGGLVEGVLGLGGGLRRGKSHAAIAATPGSTTDLTQRKGDPTQMMLADESHMPENQYSAYPPAAVDPATRHELDQLVMAQTRITGRLQDLQSQAEAQAQGTPEFDAARRAFYDFQNQAHPELDTIADRIKQIEPAVNRDEAASFGPGGQQSLQFQDALQSSPAPVQQQQAPPMSPEHQAAQEAMGQRAQEIKQIRAQAAEFGVTKPGDLDTFEQLMKMASVGLVTPQDIGTQAANLAAGQKGQVKTFIGDIQKAQEDKAKTTQALAENKASAEAAAPAKPVAAPVAPATKVDTPQQALDVLLDRAPPATPLPSAEARATLNTLTERTSAATGDEKVSLQKQAGVLAAHIKEIDAGLPDRHRYIGVGVNLDVKADDGTVATLKIKDAGKVIRSLDKREQALQALVACVKRGGK